MFFYIFHQINHKIKGKNDTDGSVNTRTLILGGSSYIILHALLYKPSSPLYFYKDYLWYFFMLDICVMAVIYKLYYGRNIFFELNPYEEDEYNEKKHKYVIKNKKNKISKTSTDKKSNDINENIIISKKSNNEISKTTTDTETNEIKENVIIEQNDNLKESNNPVIKDE